jgi:hypothetical protein
MRDPLNNPKQIDPEIIRNANAKDDVDLHFDRLDDTVTEINAYEKDTHKIIDKFSQHIKICIKYQDENQDGFVDNAPYKIDELTLKVYELDEITKQWIPIDNSVVDPEANKVTARIDQLSTFVLRGVPLRPAAVLGKVRVYPNPYRYRIHTGGVHFGGAKPTIPPEERLTAGIIKIFTITGELIKTLIVTEDDAGYKNWDLTNEDGEPVATGIYIYQITNNQGGETTGKIAIIR